MLQMCRWMFIFSTTLEILFETKSLSLHLLKSLIPLMAPLGPVFNPMAMTPVELN